MKSITEKFYTGCKKIENQDELKKYKKKARKLRDLPLRGNTHLSGLEFRPKNWVSDDSEDVYVVHFDEHGNQQEFVKDYFIQRNGKVYTLRKNGTKRDLSLQKNGCFELRLKKDANGKSIRISPKQTFLQCTSYFVDYDGWDIIMQNRGKTGSAQVDHVLQENEADVDIQCLDLVTHTENVNRKCLDPKNTETNQKAAKSQGKPFTITIKEVDKDDIVLDATSSYNGVDLLKQQGITVVRETIRKRLNKTFEKEFKQNGKTVVFKYTEEFLEDQEDIPDEIWRTEEEWNLAKEIIKEFENKKDVGPPKAISNFGRIKTNTGKVTYGSYVSVGVYGEHKYNGARVHRLVGLAFNDHPENDPNRQGYTPEKTVVRHINEHELKARGIDEKKYRIDKEGRKVLSNHIDTLEFGTHTDNMQDLSNKMIYEAQQIPMNKFRVTPLRKDRPEIPGTFHSVSEFLNFVKEKKIGITFDNSHVNAALKGKRKSHKYYKFTYVIPRVETQ